MKRRILLTDDDAGLRYLVSLTVNPDELELRCVADGEEALRLAAVGWPDLVVLDVNLPGRAGFEVCRLLRQGKETGSLPVILLTARAAESDRAEGLAAGADAYLVKPFSPIALLDLVRALLARTPAVTLKSSETGRHSLRPAPHGEAPAAQERRWAG